MICLDTSFMIDLLNNKPEATKKAKEFGAGTIVTTSINVFEILFGLYFKPNDGKLKTFSAFIDSIEVLYLDVLSSSKSAKIRSELMKKGDVIEVTDSLVAGTMLANNCNTIVTRDKHFERIKEIRVEGY